MKRLSLLFLLVLSACGGSDNSDTTPNILDDQPGSVPAGFSELIDNESSASDQQSTEDGSATSVETQDTLPLGLHSEAKRENVTWIESDTAELVEYFNNRTLASFQPEYYRLSHFAMLMQATQTESAEALMGVLNLSNNDLVSDRDEFWRLLNSLDSELTKSTPYDSEALFWGQHDYPFDSTYIDNVVTNFGVSLINGDFRQENAEQEIEQQFATKLNCCIENVYLNTNEWTKLITSSITNIQLDWSIAFNELAEPQEFQLLNGRTEMVSMMSQTAELLYYRDDEKTVLSPSITESDWQVYFVMPHRTYDPSDLNISSTTFITPIDGEDEPDNSLVSPEQQTYEQIKDSINLEYLSNIKDQLATSLVELTMPSTESTLYSNSLSLIFPLNSEEDADFSGLNPDSIDELFVASGSAEAAIRITDKGFYASSLVTLTLELKPEFQAPAPEQNPNDASVILTQNINGSSFSEVPQPISITLDRPFMFFVEHKPSKLILYIGEVTSPQ